MSDSWDKTCPLDRDQVTKAVKALKSFITKSKKDGDKLLLEEHNTIQIQVIFHKIPALKEKSFYITLPHSLFPKGSEICLITKDTEGRDNEKSEEHYQDFLKAKGVNRVKKVLPITLIKKDYRSYESRRKLVDMYDLFLCDKAILNRMPTLLGKIFMEKRKDPWGVTISNNELKRRIDAKINQTRWYMSGKGACSNITVAKTTFSVSDIVENIMTCAVELAKKAPRGWHNVACLNIRTDNSIALPIYYNDNPVDVDDLDLRELDFLTKRQEYRQNKKKLLTLAGQKRRERRHDFPAYLKKPRTDEDEELFQQQEA